MFLTFLMYSIDMKIYLKIFACGDIVKNSTPAGGVSYCSATVFHQNLINQALKNLVVFSRSNYIHIKARHYFEAQQYFVEIWYVLQN